MNFLEVSFLNAHNSIHNYDLSLCDTSLSNSEFVPDNILQGYNYHAITIMHVTIQVVRKRAVLVFFLRTHYLL